MQEPKFGAGDIVTIRKDKHVGIIKESRFLPEERETVYSVAWLGEFLEHHVYKENELKNY